MFNMFKDLLISNPLNHLIKGYIDLDLILFKIKVVILFDHFFFNFLKSMEKYKFMFKNYGFFIVIFFLNIENFNIFKTNLNINI